MSVSREDPSAGQAGQPWAEEASLLPQAGEWEPEREGDEGQHGAARPLFAVLAALRAWHVSACHLELRRRACHWRVTPLQGARRLTIDSDHLGEVYHPVTVTSDATRQATCVDMAVKRFPLLAVQLGGFGDG